MSAQQGGSRRVVGLCAHHGYPLSRRRVVQVLALQDVSCGVFEG
jgi:hypothetical protein